MGNTRLDVIGGKHTKGNEMTQDEIMEMSEKVELSDNGLIYAGDYTKELVAFAKLIEDRVTARYMQLFLDPENQPTQFGTAIEQYREQEIKDEREACARVCEEDDSVLNFGQCAAAIRARGEQ
jgi:hypothetical protein